MSLSRYEKRAQALGGIGSLSQSLEGTLASGSSGHLNNSTCSHGIQELDYQNKHSCKRDPHEIASSLLVNTYEYNFRNSKEKRFELLYGIKRLNGMRSYAIRNCMSFMPKAGMKREIELVKKHDDQLAMKNLVYCSSIWLCPVCSSRIASERRKELSQAVQLSGAYTALITYTLSHSIHDPLDELLGALRKAVNSTKSGRWYEEFIKDHGIMASVSSLEFTHGEHGWHPHIHQLVFFNEKPDPERIHEQLSERFGHYVEKIGHYSSSYHGIDVRCSRKDVSGYISKWNVIQELSNVQAKRGRKESLNIWQIAQLAIAGDPECEDLWLEYAKASYRKKALQWSRGAREALGIEAELSDEELIKKEEADLIAQEVEHICSFTPEEYFFLQDRGLIGEVFYRARIGGAEEVNELFIRIRGKPLNEFLESSHYFILEEVEKA